MKKRRLKKISLTILCFLLSALILCSGYMVWKDLSAKQSDISNFEELQEIVEEKPKDISDDLRQETKEPTEKKRNLHPILLQNSDCIGWICIPNTNINYPVMHTPNEPQKYLRLNFDKQYSSSGVPFLDYRCSDETNLIIYGHNMKNGTMFSDLKKYLDLSFLNANKIIEFETTDGVSYFEIVEVIRCDNTSKIYGNIIETETRELMLSTCYGSSKNGRLVIRAKEIKKGVETC